MTIQEMHEAGVAQSVIARMYGLSRQRVEQLLSPERQAARGVLHGAIASGAVTRPAACSVCGKNNRPVHGHHEDYSKPLEVIWLCGHCHGKRHADQRPRKERPGVQIDPTLPGNLSEVMAALARRGHSKRTKAQRSAAARKAVNARWAKAKKKER